MRHNHPISHNFTGGAENGFENKQRVHYYVKFPLTIAALPLSLNPSTTVKFGQFLPRLGGATPKEKQNPITIDIDW